MIHPVFDRPTQTIKAFNANGSVYRVFRGEGDAWGHTADNEYGHDAWMPPGHYLLGAPQFFAQPIASEGFGQIPISDLDAATLGALVAAGKATANGSNATIGGIVAAIGGLAKYDRSALFVHGGGSNAPQPFADYQMLCKTEGCPRMWNAEWREFALWLQDQSAGNTIVFTVIGNPVILAC